MSPKVRAVYFKELRDSLRDRRTLVATVLVPLVLYPVMLLGVGEVSQMARTRLENTTAIVGVPAGSTAFFEMLQKQSLDEKTSAELPGLVPVEPVREPDDGPAPPKGKNGFALKELPVTALQFRELSGEQADRELLEGKLQAIVKMDANFEASVKALQPASLEIKFDQAEVRSRDARSRLEFLLERYKKTVIRERLKSQRLDSAFLRPFVLTTNNVAPAQKVSGSVVGMFLPLLFIMMIITGAMHTAIDMTAGEKERATLETLISTPVRPIEIIAGKFLAVSTFALGNAAINVGSFGLSFMLMPQPQSMGFEFPWSALPLTLLLLVPLTLFFAALLLAVSSFAANYKEAQVYCLPIYLIPVIGMMLVMMPGIELEGPLLIAPVVNTALLIKELFLSHGTAQQVVFVFVSTCLYAAVAVALAARVFAREDVLFSAQSSFRLFLSRRFMKPSQLPRPGDSLLLVALLFPANFYFQIWLAKLLYDPAQGMIPVGSLVLMVLLPLWLLFLALPLAAAWYLKLNLRETFMWKAPPARAMFGAVLLGSGSWIIASQLAHWQSLFWHYTPGEAEALEKSMQVLSQSNGGLALLIFMIGVTPAICEEHFFRGFLQQGLRGSGKWLTLLTVGLLFGAFHFPMFRQPVVGALGVVIAYVAFESRSLLPSVIFHFVHNSLCIVGPMILGVEQTKPVAGEPLPPVPLQYLLPACGSFALGLWLARRPGTKETVETPALPAAQTLSAAVNSDAQ